MSSIILLGSGGHCKSCIDVIEKSHSHKIKGIIDKPNQVNKEFMGYKILGNDNQLQDHFQENDCSLVCVGQIQTDVKPFLRVAGAIEQHLPLIPRQCVASATSNKHHTISNIFKPLSGIKFQQFCDPLFVDAKQQQKEK